MTIFIDASALIAIMAGENDAEDLTRRLERDEDRHISTMAIWETVAGLRKSHAVPIADGRTRADRFLMVGRIKMATIDPAILQLALDAYDTYGKGRHPAALNMGDCFAYACAKALKATLLYKGDDFVRTDLA